MNYQAIEHEGIPILECVSGEDGFLATERDALDLIAACGESGAQCLLLMNDCLPDEFFNLRTGLAGTALQKFDTYQIRVAAVLTPERATHGRFGEMVLEANRGNFFHVFSNRKPALDWLAKVGQPGE